jgi:hypothetical protein
MELYQKFGSPYRILKLFFGKDENKKENEVYLTPIIQLLSMNVKIIVITLFLVTMGTLTTPTFAQQFEEPNYTIRGGEVLGFEMDSENTSLIISIDTRARGELIITLPRSLIDAKIGSEDSEFIVTVGILQLNSFDEIKTSSDRTITIPIKRSSHEIKIIGTHVFSQVATAPTIQLEQQIEKKIESELRSEIPEGEAKLLIFSDTQWSGAFQVSGFDVTEIVGQSDRVIIFGCEPPLVGERIFGAKIKKMTEEGYLKIVAIQNQKIISQESTEKQFGEVLINGNCVSSFTTGPEGGGCLIATAIYGSELAPQVQQLRELRDNKLLQTESGSAFMESFNDFYYSFSPVIADYERENHVFKELVKIAITPMISSLSVLNHVDMKTDAEVLGYGISLIALNVGMYAGVPAIVVVGIRKGF